VHREPRKAGKICTDDLRFVCRWVVLTVLLAITACADITADISAQISMNEATGAGAIMASFSELFVVFGTAMMTSTVLYALRMFFMLSSRH
jgi:hypothetical protein